MPYVSDRQRRFFHTDTARKHGITPAMVREYDESSRGKDLPEKAEKKAEGGSSDGATSGVSTTVSAPKPPTVSNPARANNAVKGGPKPAPWPGDYKQNFLESAASAAQRSTADKFEAGERTTMPVTR